MSTPTPLDQDAITQGNLGYEKAQDHMALLPNYYRLILSFFGSSLGGRVVDLGCGAGHFMAAYAPLAREIVAVDINPLLLAQLPGRLAGRTAPLRAVEMDLLGDWSRLAGVRADTVVALDVLEHMADDRAALAKMRDLLAPGGRLLLKVPAQSRLFGPTDVASGHYRRYDLAPLAQLARDTGWQTERLGYVNPMGAWLYRFKRKKDKNFSRTMSPSLLKMINLGLPLLRPVFSLPGCPGLSIMGVLRKD